MDTASPNEPRGYSSALRDAQRGRTHQRILDGLIRVLGANPGGGFTIPAVAKEAGVSTPTVYRHFPDKEALVAALQEHLETRLGTNLAPGKVGLDETLLRMRSFFEKIGGLEPELKALAHSALTRESRRSRREERKRWFDLQFGEVIRSLPPEEAGYLRDVLFVLMSSNSVHAFDEYLGLDGAAAADRVEWTVRRLLRGLPSTAAGESS